MRIKKLRFRGFGPYTQEQSVPFPSVRKISIEGDNGAGKTFLLDTIPAVLFKNVPNRQGGFYENFSGNDAFIEFEFEYHGSSYVAKRLINANSRTQKAYLSKDGEVLTDGKEKEFEAQIKRLGFNEISFLAAIYQSQSGEGSALNMDVGGKMELLSIILNLFQFDQDHEKAAEAVKKHAQEMERLKTQIATLESQLPDILTLVAEKQVKTQRVETLIDDIVNIDREIQLLTENVGIAKANAQGLDDLKRESANLTEHILTDSATLEDNCARIKNNQEMILNRRVEILAAVEEKQVLESEYEQLHKAAIENQTRINDWITSHSIALKDKQDALTQAKLRLDKASSEHKDKLQLNTELTNKRIQALNVIESLKPQAELKNRVPCVGDEKLHTTCELLKNAHASIEKMGELAKLAQSLEDALANHLPKMEFSKANEQAAQSSYDLAYQNQQAVINDQVPDEWKQSIETLAQMMAGIKAEIQALDKLAAYADKLEDAEKRVSDLQRDNETIMVRLNTNRQALDEKRQKIVAASDIERTIQDAERHRAEKMAQKQIQEGDKLACLSRINQIDAQLEQVEGINLQLDDLRIDLQKAVNLSADLKLLRDSLGPKGAKNLKIDAAGKAITERANRLIRIALGPQFSIAINTLKELQTKDEDGNPEVRETLELKIIDSNTGQEKLINNLSGGEQAMASLVFSLSLAIEQRQSSGLDIRTLILDEPSAGLSAENCVRYLEMLDAVLAETGIEQVLFITHMPIMQSLADARIKVVAGKDSSEVRVS